MALSKKFLQPINLLNSDSDPVSAVSGDFYYNTISKKIKYYNGNQWVGVSDTAPSGAGISVSETPPTATTTGEGWFKSSTSELFIWDGTFWVEATSTVQTFQLFEVGATPPSSPLEGTGWFDNVSGDFYIYDGTYWQQVVRTVQVDLVADNTPQLGGDLDGNGFGIDNIDYIDFDTTTTTVPTEGAVVWNSGEGTLSLGLLGGNVDLDIGQENVVLCYNGTASAMSKGDVVYITGAQGQKPSIALASAAAESSSSKTLGVVAESISSGGDGFVTTFGMVKGVNTSLFTEGSALWLSTTAGDLTQTIPTSPNHAVFVGYCLKSDASSGRIFVEPQNGYEIEELHNVLITSVADNDIVSYESATGLWKNQNLATAIGEVDGAGSGIDADLLDGQQGTYYAADSSVVHIAGSETITGEKTFQSKLIVDSQNSEGTIQLGDISTGTSTTDQGVFFVNELGTIESAIFTEVDGQILSYGVNVGQITDRDITKTGGIFRLDTRNANKEFRVIAQPAGVDFSVGPNEFTRIISKLDTGLSGINTATPAYSWDVSGGTRTYGLISSAISTPGVATGTASETGGTLAAATYYIRIVAVDGNGNTTLAGAESSGIVTTGTTSSIRLTWTQVAGAQSYRIYYSTTSGTYSAYYESYIPLFILTETNGTAGSLPTKDTTGYVGIGTASPEYPIHTVGTVDPTGMIMDAVGIVAANVYGRRARGALGSETAIQANDNMLSLTGAGYVDGEYKAGSTIQFRATENWVTGSQGSHIVFRTTENGTTTQIDRVRINHDGKVGIGTNSPVSKLHISDVNVVDSGLYTSDYVVISTENTAPGFNIICASDLSAGHRGVFKATRSRGTLSNPTVPLVNDDVFSLLGAIYDGNGNNSTAEILMEVDGTVSDGVSPQRIVFSTGETTSRTERMRITSSGNVGIGTTTPSHKLEVNGSFAATTKSFDIKHPTKENMRLRYGSLESPYHGINLTGESFTKKGICKVELPDYIHGLVKKDGINIQLTNIGHGKVMWVEDIDIENNNFIVRTKSKKECRFFWSLVAIRKDINDLVVEYEKDNA